MDAVLERKLVVEFVGMFLFVFTVGVGDEQAGAERGTRRSGRS